MTTTRIPFNIIDEAFVHVDDPVCPISVQIEARVDGRLDEDRLRRAVMDALDLHPLARARLEPWAADAQGYEWLIDSEPQVDPLRVVDAGDGLDLVRSELYSQPLSLFESPPLRVRLARHDEGDVVMVSIHHSASDGMGARRLLQSIGRAYAGVADPVPDFDPAAARQLAVPSDKPSLGALLHSGRMELQRMTRLGSRPARLTPDGETTRAGYGVRTLSVPLGPVVSAPLRKQTGATVNDVLIVAAVRAAGRWIEEHDLTAGRVSAQMPINARPAEWSDQVVANLVTGDSVSTIEEERASAEQCLRSVAGWTEAVKKRGPGPALAALNTMPRTPVIGRKAATQWALQAGGALADTFVLSNLGLIPEDWIGGEGFDVTEVFFSPPTPLGLGLGAVACNGRLVLTLRYLWTLWDEAAADRFAAVLGDEIDELTGA